jgi:integrase
VDSESEADALLEAVAAQLDTGSYVDPTRGLMRVNEFAGRYLAARVDLEQSTLVSYESHLRVHVVARIGNRKLTQITPDLLSAMYQRMLTDGVSVATVKAVHRVVHGMFAHAVLWKYLPENPAASAITPKQEQREYETWTPDQLARFLELARDHRWGIGYLLSVATGMRRAEVCGLRWDNVDLDAGRLDVRTTRLEIGSQIVDKPSPKSKHGRRTIALDDGVVAALRAQLLEQKKNRLALGEAWTDSGFVLTNPDGAGIRPNAYSQAFKRLLRKAGLPEIRLHDIRHTWGTLAVAAGIDPKTVSLMLGHATVGFTLDVYSHGTDEKQQQAASLMGRLIGG